MPCESPDPARFEWECCADSFDGEPARGGTGLVETGVQAARPRVVSAGNASTYVPLSLVSWRYSSTLRTISCSSARSSSTSAAVEIVFPLPYFTGAGSFNSSNSTRPSCCGELMLNGLPAIAWISPVSRAISVSIRSESRLSSLESMRMPVISTRASTFAAAARWFHRACADDARVDFLTEVFKQLERVVGVLLGRRAQF